MSVVRTLAVRTLLDTIENGVPELLDKTRKVWADPSEDPVPPVLVAVPMSFEFIPWQEDEVADPGNNRSLLQVGDWVGKMELRLLGKSANERETIEEQITNLFFNREGAPGTLFTVIPNLNVAGINTGYATPITYCIDSSDWQEEFVFSKKRWSFMDVDVCLPALVLRGNVYTIEQLITAFTNDLTSDSPSTEDVVVNEDGSISAI